MTEPGPRPSQTVGPFFPFACRSRAATGSWPPTTPRRSGSRAGCSTARASRCPTRCSSSGRPTPPGATPTPTTPATTSRCEPGFTGFGRVPTDADGRLRSPRSSRAAVPRPDGARAGAAPRHVGLRARAARPPRDPRLLPRRDEAANAADPGCSASRTPTARRDADRGGRWATARLPLRHPAAGRRRDRVLRRLSASVRRRCSARDAAAEARSPTRAWLQAMLDVEAALARAEAGVGLVPAAAAEAIAAVLRRRPLRPRRDRPRRRARRQPGASRSSRALIAAVRERDGRRPLRPLGRHQPGRPRHRRDAGRPPRARRSSLADLAGAAGAAAALAARAPRHADGGPDAAAAGAADHLRAQGGRLAASRCSTPAGAWPRCAPTGWPPSSAARRARSPRSATAGRGVAARARGRARAWPSRSCPGTPRAAGSASWPAPWPSRRARCDKIALDVGLLAQTEVGEVAEPAAEGKAARRPCRTSATRSAPCAPRRPRAASPALGRDAPGRDGPGARARRGRLAGRVGDAAASAGADRRRGCDACARCSSGLEVDPGRMRENLDATGGLLLAERVTMALAERVGRARGPRRSSRPRASAWPRAGRRCATSCWPRTRSPRTSRRRRSTSCSTRRATSARRAPSSTGALAAYGAGGDRVTVALAHRARRPRGRAAAGAFELAGHRRWRCGTPQLGPLAAHPRVLRYDQRGHGASPVPRRAVRDRRPRPRRARAARRARDRARVASAASRSAAWWGCGWPSQAPERVDRLVAVQHRRAARAARAVDGAGRDGARAGHGRRSPRPASSAGSPPDFRAARPDVAARMRRHAALDRRPRATRRAARPSATWTCATRLGAHHRPDAGDRGRRRPGHPARARWRGSAPSDSRRAAWRC